MDEETTPLAHHLRDMQPGDSSKLMTLLEGDSEHLTSLTDGILRGGPLEDDARSLIATVNKVLLPGLELQRKAPMVGSIRPNHDHLATELVAYFHDWRTLMQKIITALKGATPATEETQTQ